MQFDIPKLKTKLSGGMVIMINKIVENSVNCFIKTNQEKIYTSHYNDLFTLTNTTENMSFSAVWCND